MASPHAAVLSIAILALLPTALRTAQPPTTSSSGETGCGARLLILAPCLPFVQGGSPVPPDACCDGLADVYRDQPQCLCLLLNGSASLPINHTLALRLPLLCRLALPDDASTCPGLTLPPSPSPNSREVSGSSANSSGAASPTAMASLPARMSNHLPGLNRGGKLRVEGAPIVMAAAILLVGV